MEGDVVTGSTADGRRRRGLTVGNPRRSLARGLVRSYRLHPAGKSVGLRLAAAVNLALSDGSSVLHRIYKPYSEITNVSNLVFALRICGRSRHQLLVVQRQQRGLRFRRVEALRRGKTSQIADIGRRKTMCTTTYGYAYRQSTVNTAGPFLVRTAFATSTKRSFRARRRGFRPRSPFRPPVRRGFRA